jgi:hypothetical protein
VRLGNPECVRDNADRNSLLKELRNRSVRDRWGFDAQVKFCIGTLFANAAGLRVSKSKRELFPIHDDGNPLPNPGALEWVPNKPR